MSQASPFGPAELVHFGGDGHDADRPGTRKIDEHALFDLGVTASVDEQNEATEERPAGEVALGCGGESLAIALRGARKAVARKVHQAKSDSVIDEEVDTPRPAGGLAHSREVTPAADAVQQRRLSRVRAPGDGDLDERPAWILRGGLRRARVVEEQVRRLQNATGLTSMVRPRTSVKRK